MVARLSHISVNCSDAFELSEWWKEVLGYADVEGDPNEAGDEECMILDPNGQQQLLFIEVANLQVVPGRIHFDICAAGSTRDQEVERILGLGATPVADRRNPDGSGWMTLADPAGNHFCIVRSDAERESAL